MIVFEIRATEEYLREKFTRYKKQNPMRRINLIAEFIIAGILIYYASKFLFMGLTLLSMFFIAGLFLMFVPRYIEEIRTIRRFKKEPYFNEVIKFEVDESGVKTSNAEGGWDVYTKVRRFNDGFLLFDGPFASWLPDVSMTSGSVEEFERLITTNVKDYKKVG